MLPQPRASRPTNGCAPRPTSNVLLAEPRGDGCGSVNAQPVDKVRGGRRRRVPGCGRERRRRRPFERHSARRPNRAGYGPVVAHRPQEIAAFTDGERALVYAARRDDPDAPLVFLRDGSAAEMRSHTTAHLQCFVPGCPTPAFTTVARQGKRDGFRHLTGGNHAPESLFHRQGKQALVDWLASTRPDVRARMEVPLPGRVRVADVLAETASVRIALEVQYASLTATGAPGSWQARTDDCIRAGIGTVWFFGHYGAHMTVVPGGAVALNAVQRQVVAAGHKLWWINPVTGQIATAYVPVHLEGRTFHIPPRAGAPVVWLAIAPLHDARLANDGVHTHASEDHERQAGLYSQLVEELEARRLAAARIRAAAEQKEAERAARARRQAAEHAQAAALRLNERREREATAWFSSRTYTNVLAACGGAVPPYLDHADPLGAVYAHHQHWQATVYGDLIRGRVGGTVSVDACLTVLDHRGFRYRSEARRAVADWLQLLVSSCHLVSTYRSDRWRVTDPDVERARRAAAKAERGQRFAKHEEIAQPTDVPEQIPVSAPFGHQVRPVPEVKQGRDASRLDTACRECGERLAPQLAAVGVDRHIGCPSLQEPRAADRRGPTRCCKGCAYPLPSDSTSRYHPACEPWAEAAARSARAIAGS